MLIGRMSLYQAIGPMTTLDADDVALLWCAKIFDHFDLLQGEAFRLGVILIYLHHV